MCTRRTEIETIDSIKNRIIKILKVYTSSNRVLRFSSHHRDRAKQIIDFINRSQCCFEILLIIEFNIALYDRSQMGATIRQEIRQRFDDKLNLFPKLFSDHFMSNHYSTKGGYYKSLNESKNVLNSFGYQINLEHNIIYINFIYLGKRISNLTLSKVMRVSNYLRNNLLGCNLLATNSHHGSRTKEFHVKTILWYDNHIPHLSFGQNIEVKKIDELIDVAENLGCDQSVFKQLINFAKAKSIMMQGAIGADVLKFIISYLYGGFYIDCGYMPDIGEAKKFSPFYVKNHLKFALNNNASPTIIPTSDEIKHYLRKNTYHNRKDHDDIIIYPNIDSHIIYSSYNKHPIFFSIMTNILKCIQDDMHDYLFKRYISSRMALQHEEDFGMQHHYNSMVGYYPGLITNSKIIVYSLYKYGLLHEHWYKDLEEFYEAEEHVDDFHLFIFIKCASSKIYAPDLGIFKESSRSWTKGDIKMMQDI